MVVYLNQPFIRFLTQALQTSPNPKNIKNNAGVASNQKNDLSVASARKDGGVFVLLCLETTVDPTQATTDSTG